MLTSSHAFRLPEGRGVTRNLVNERRRRWLRTTAAWGAAALCGRSGVARGESAQAVRLLVGYSAGGAVDTIARTLAQQLQDGLGQTLIVDNRPGAGTNIAMRALIDSAPDGRTLMLVANAVAANPTLYQPAPFDPARDLTPIALVGRVPVVIATSPGSGLASVAALVARAKAEPAAVTFGTPGNGSTPHLALALFARTAGIELTHVPYKGGAPALTDALAGRIALLAVNALEVISLVRAGRLRVLAVLSPQRSALLPGVPTIAESGCPGFEASVWYGVVGPAGMAAPHVARLHDAIETALAGAPLRERLASAGGDVLPGSVDGFAALLAQETARYRVLIRNARIQPD